MIVSRLVLFPSNKIDKVIDRIDMLALPKTIFCTLMLYSFPEQIKTFLTKGEINDRVASNKRELMKFKCNQMMHSYTFCTFYGDQSLNTG